MFYYKIIVEVGLRNEWYLISIKKEGYKRKI